MSELQPRTAPTKTRLSKLIVALLCAQLGSTAMSAERQRSAEPVTFANKSMALTIAPDGKVSLNRDGKLVSEPGSSGWSIYHWTTGKSMKDGTRIALDNMAKVGPNELLLWSSEGTFEVKVAITAKDRYFKFELVHVSNDPKTGDLNKDWPGHRVEFDIRTAQQDDGWQLHTLLLNPMSELATRSPFTIEDGVTFCWPYPQWAQTTDRPQPQGAVAVYGFVGDAEHDDILLDVWAAEPSLPRPNRAQLKSWTRADAQAWMARWSFEMRKPVREFSISPNGDPRNLYKLTDLAAKDGINRLYLHNFDWQGDSVGLPSREHFPKGVEDVIQWREYCRARGIKIKLHGFGAIFLATDKKYGRTVLPDGLAKSARGTLVSDFAAGQKTIVVKPDYDFYPGMKPGMPPYMIPPPWGKANSGYGATFAPYFETNDNAIRVKNTLYEYTATVTADNLWKIELGKPHPGSAPSAASAGDAVEFIVMGTKGWLVPDPRSPMNEEMAKDYAAILNVFQGPSNYDGAGWSEPLGTWGLRKTTQIVYEHMDHPAQSSSSMGIPLFGNFEYQFKAVQSLFDGGRESSMTIVPSEIAMLASSMDDANHSINRGVWSKDMSVRGNHRGISVEDAEEVGIWDEALKAFKLWSEMKPYMSDAQKALIDSRKKRVEPPFMSDVFVASETADQWQVTRTRIMRREGIDAGWQRIAERPDVGPRQFLKANGESLKDLHNPYASQAPVVELHVMAGMSATAEANLAFMPKKADDIVNPKGVAQPLGFDDGKLTLSFDNTRSNEDYVYYYGTARDYPRAHWLLQSLGHSKTVDMTGSRGLAVTVEGDGSGAVLFVTLGTSFPRVYAIDINFTGRRTIEIPNGEVCNNRYGYDAYKTITAFGYEKVDRVGAVLHKVPAGKKAEVKILDVQALREDRNTGLIDPGLTLNGIKVVVNGTIPYNHYLVYAGGSNAKVYDANWKFVKDLPVTAEGKLEATHGSNTFSVSAPASPNAWLSSRIKVEDSANRITIQKPKGAR